MNQSNMNKTHHQSIRAIIAGFCLAVAGTTQAGNWPQFRGPAAQGHSTETGLPLTWSATENIAWKTPIPGESWSSPVVWADRVFLTTGIVATFDSQHKSGGNRGLTIANTGPTTKRSSMAKFARPHQDLAGCNALRLWFKPYGLKASEGTVSMVFIDGSSEIWQVDLPEVLSATEPFVLQVRLADFRRVLRRNNGRIDLENRDFCFWMTGTYKFTVDDILFVHDPAMPEFSNTPTQNKLTK